MFQYDIGTHIKFQGKQAVSQGEPLYYSALVLLTSEVENYTTLQMFTGIVQVLPVSDLVPIVYPLILQQMNPEYHG